MRIVWFLPVDHSDFNRMPASVWIRALQLVPYLKALGIRSFFNDETVEADISVFVRRQDAEAAAIAERQRQRGQSVVFDLCVNYFDASGAPGMDDPVTDRHIRECRAMVDLADAVTCASANIAARARDFHERVQYFPDSVDRRHFKYRKDVGDFARRRLVLAWSGVASKAVELEPYLFDRRLSKFGAHFIAEKAPPLFLRKLIRAPLGVRFAKWKYKEFPTQLLRGDICFAPRQLDAAYNQGHSFFKIGVFLAQGVPVVASPVPSYRELMTERPCGVLCDSDNEIFDVLNDVERNRDLLVRWSENAVDVMEPYHTEAVALQYASFYRDLSRRTTDEPMCSGSRHD